MQLHNKNNWSPEWEELAGRREQKLCCCLSFILLHVLSQSLHLLLIARAAVQLLSYLVQSMHRNVGGLDVLQVPLSIVLEIIGDAEPVKEMWGGYLLLGLLISPPAAGAGDVPKESGHRVINSSD